MRWMRQASHIKQRGSRQFPIRTSWLLRRLTARSRLLSHKLYPAPLQVAVIKAWKKRAMSTTKTYRSTSAVATETETQTPRIHTTTLAAMWRERIFLPLWLFLLFALGLRIFLVVHTHSVIDGDKGLGGTQAERVLHGRFLVYFYFP